MSLPGSRSTARPVLLVTLGVAGAALLLAGCGAGQRAPATTSAVPLPPPASTKQAVTQANFGYLWPLSVDHGTLECRSTDQVVFVTPEGKGYALNDKAEAAGMPKIDPLRSEGSQGGNVSLGALLSTGLDLCGKG
jgi:hypothetical protein